MPGTEPFFSINNQTAPRHAPQEIADLLGSALCRLLSRNARLLAAHNGDGKAPVGLGFSGTQSVYGNSSQPSVIDTESDHAVN